MHSKPRHDLPRVLLIQPFPAPSATIYIVKPLTELARQRKLIFDTMLESQATVSLIRSSDLVLFSRNNEPAADWILEECLAHEIPTVYDLDDNLWEVPRELPYASFYRAPERLGQLERYLIQANAVRVYSQPLFERVSRFNKNVHQIRACIDMRQVPTTPPPQKDDKIRITYVTTRGGSDALITLFAADLFEICNTFPDLVEMYWWGEIPELFRSHPASRLLDVFHDYDKFLQFLSQEGFSIGLAPLTSSTFNLSKTNTKFRDYGACRLAGIYSDVDVFSTCVIHEKTGLLVNNQPGSWFAAMSRLITDRRLRETIQTEAYHYVYENYRQELVEAEWEELIASLLAERRRKFYPAFTPPTGGRRVSLGCREGLPGGFIEVDRHPCLGASLIADMDRALPLTADSVELLVADLDQAPGAIEEIYRICKHGAQACLLAAYSRGSDKGFGFDEYSPRLWTNITPPVYQIDALDKELLEDAQPRLSAPGMDLRCLRMEFFYAPEYAGIPEAQKAQLRRDDPSACEQILYHCLAIKQPVSAEEFQELQNSTQYFIPQGVIERRMEDLNAAFVSEIQHLRSEAKSTQGQIAARDLELEAMHTEFQRKEEATERLKQQALIARFVARELDAHRNRKATQIADRIFGRGDMSASLAPAMQRLKDDSLVFLPSLSGYHLQPSINLQRVPYLSYPLILNRANLSGISLATLLDIYPLEGTLRIQIVTSNEKVLAQAAVPASGLAFNSPVAFNFLPIRESGSLNLELRVLARDLDVPVRVLEWHRHTFFGLGRRHALPFCSFEFAADQRG